MKRTVRQTLRPVWFALIAGIPLTFSFAQSSATAQEANLVVVLDATTPANSKATISIQPGAAPINSDGELVTGNSVFTVAYTTAAITVTPIVNNLPQTDANLSAGTTFPVTLTKEGTNIISLLAKPTAGGTAIPSNAIAVALDTTGPALQSAEAIESPTTGTTVLVTFDENDLKVVTGADPAVKITRQGNDGTFTAANQITIQTPIVDGRHLRIPVTKLPAGIYQLIVNADQVTDIVGNKATGVLTTTFNVLPGRSFGEQVEFPPFAPAKQQSIPKEGFNPGDYVETRVARLYYFRDAHRVAQIINRNIRSFNQSAVTQSERRAENSRDAANAATDQRREEERAAVRAAEQARNAEQQLAQAQQRLSQVQGLQNSNNAITARIATIDQLLADTNTSDAQKASLTKEKQDLQQKTSQNSIELASYGDTTNLAQSVSTMQQSVANLRETELAAREAWNEAQAKEARARATQFRDEVTAAETDPDTYVAADLHSVDPVSQVSLSVIGEGLIQMRGPIKGINTIRTMINQIDSPVGQIKIGIFTVQINGEKGAELEKAVGDAEGNVDLSRFLVNQSLNLLRRSIQSEASVIAEECQLAGHYQVDRDRRYLYAFFGRDFIDELYEMNSEFMFTENKLLSLHAMDTVSLNRALFILALAKNDIRQRIVTRFLESAKTELPDAEYDFRRSSELNPHRTEKRFPPWNLTHLPLKNRYDKEQRVHEAVHRNALQRYHFRNFSAFFDTGFTHADTMNPMQREFIRLAQIYKARLIAEMEWRQRVIERGLFEDRANDENERYNLIKPVHEEALYLERDAYAALVTTARKNQQTSMEIEAIIADHVGDSKLCDAAVDLIKSLKNERDSMADSKTTPEQRERILASTEASIAAIRKLLETVSKEEWLSDDDEAIVNAAIEKVALFETSFDALRKKPDDATLLKNTEQSGKDNLVAPLLEVKQIIDASINDWELVRTKFRHYRSLADQPNLNIAAVTAAYENLDSYLKTAFADVPDGKDVRTLLSNSYQAVYTASLSDERIAQAKAISKQTRGDLDQRKLLNYMIDQQEEKFIELVEGTRSHIAVMDDYLKRLSIALEDDFKIQFYDPAFVRVRDAARSRRVNLSQVERTTILTNNRAFAKVDPQATMEFDLPKRQIAIKEAFDAAKALVEDTGALVNDPTFLSAFQMMGGSQQAGTVRNIIPGQSMSTDQHTMGLVPPQPPPSTPGSALQSLVPPPSIYKLETGTGFQIRPVMQPDGDSVVYDFDYMYTTNIREPVRADEKHLGRVKRHFVHTAVQTGNFELREVSRYQVALKVSRTGQGVPLLQDIPIVGIAFRPLPSEESSLQQNIIFGQTNIYPTLFDLMGLRWAQQVVDLDHVNLLESEHVIRGRQKSIRDFVFAEASRRVDDFLNIKDGPGSANYRPDLYFPQTLPSPHHPHGYNYPGGVQDPTGNNFESIDRRPPDMQEPPYQRYRHVPVHPERIAPQVFPERIAPQAGQQLEPQLSPAHGELHVAPMSGFNYQPQPSQSSSELFQSLLLEGPDGPIENSARPGLSDGATNNPVQSTMPLQARGAAYGGMIETDRTRGRLQKASTIPVIRPIQTTRRPPAPASAGVVPASFEQPVRVQQPTKMRRLPPVR